MAPSRTSNIFQVNVMLMYKHQLERSLRNIQEYVDDVEKLYVGENCHPVEVCDDVTITNKIVGNPIYSYQVLKRLTVNWKTMEASIKEADSKSTPSFCPFTIFVVGGRGPRGH